FLDREAATENANRALAEQRARSVGARSVPAEVLQPVSSDATAPSVSRRASTNPIAEPVVVEPAKPLPSGTERIRGLLTLLDCRNGVTIFLSVDGKVV